VPSITRPILQLFLVLLIDLRILDRILFRIANSLGKFLRLFRTIREQVFPDKSLRRLAKPLEQTEVLVLVCTEDFQHLDVLIVRQVLDEVAHVAGDDAYVAGLEVECARCAFGGEDRYAGTASDEEGPFVCVGCGKELVWNEGWVSE